MQLFITAASPYVRQCRILAREKGLAVDERPIGPVPAADAAYLAANPAGHGPALVTDDGQALIGPALICAYLDSLGSPSLDGGIAGRRQEALAQAAIGFLVAMRGGGAPAPSADSAAWDLGLRRTLDVLEILQPAPFSIGAIATAVALTYADLRQPDLDWRSRRPQLVALQAELEVRPSFRATAPG